MSYREYIQLLKDCGTPRTGVDKGEIALKKSDAIKALALLDDTDIGILGGDVYELESDGYFKPTYDNWFRNKGIEEQQDFAKRSRSLANEYLSNYQEKDGVDIRYVLVLDD